MSGDGLFGGGRAFHRRHVEVTAIVPGVGGFESDSRDESQRALAVREGTDASDAAFDLTVESQGLLLPRAFLNKARPLWIRDITVPIGISRFLAISS